MEYLGDLIYIAIVLLIGTLAGVLAYMMKTSKVLILLLTGVLFAKFGLLEFNRDFVIIISIFAIIFSVFTNTSKLNFREVREHFFKVLKLNIIYLLLCVVFLSLVLYWIFDFDVNGTNSVLVLLVAVLTYGIDPLVMNDIIKKSKSKVDELLEIESLINPPLTVIISLILISTINKESFSAVGNLGGHFLNLSQSIGIPILFGLIIGYLMISILRRNYFGELTHLAVITSAIIVYVGSEFLGGTGVIGIAIYGVMFGNSHVSHLIEIEKFESIIANSIKILTFMLFGSIIVIKLELTIIGLVILFSVVLIRFFSVWISYGNELDFKKKLFLGLFVPKGMESVVVLLLITSLITVPKIDMIIGIITIIIIYGIILSTVVGHYSKFFMGKKNVTKVKRN